MPSSPGSVDQSVANTPVYTVVTFAPVQGFISSSRKLRDLYGSSLLLSVLAKAIVDDARGRGFEVLSPASADVARGVPNTLVIRGLYKKGHAQDALKSTWGAILSSTREWIETTFPQFTYDWEPIWKQWRDHAWEVFQAQGDSIESARRRLALSKQSRAWSGINWTGESSTLGGSDAIARPSMGKVIPPYKVVHGEADTEAKAFIAALAARFGDAFAGKGEQPSLPELVKRLVTYPDVARDAFPAEAADKVRPPRFDAIANSNRICWFMADGDGVGDHLKKQAGGDAAREAMELQNFSKALGDWAEQLYTKVPDPEHMNGMATVVYAGGDDLLGALHGRPDTDDQPVQEDLSSKDLFRWLKIFPALWEDHGQGISVSMGLVWTTDKVPQREALQQVREAESSAKKGGKDRFALRLLFSGGQSIEWVCPWTLLPRLLEGYHDRWGLSGAAANWGHLAADVGSLQGRRALGTDQEPESGEAVAAALWAMYFPDLNPPPRTQGGKDIPIGHITQPLAAWLTDLAGVMTRLQKPESPVAAPEKAAA